MNPIRFHALLFMSMLTACTGSNEPDNNTVQGIRDKTNIQVRPLKKTLAGLKQAGDWPAAEKVALKILKLRIKQGFDVKRISKGAFCAKAAYEMRAVLDTFASMPARRGSHKSKGMTHLYEDMTRTLQKDGC